MNRFNKYKPSKLTDIIGNDNNIKIAHSWISQYKDYNCLIQHPILLISGSSGTGKTSFAKLLLKEYGFHLIEYNSHDFKSKKTLEDDIKNLLHSNNVITMFSGKKERTAILIDNIDTVVNNDKGGLSKIISVIKNCKNKKNYRINVPIICISSGNKDRKLTDIKKLSNSISFYSIKGKDYLSYIKIVTKDNGIKMGDTLLLDLYDYSENNMQITILNLLEIYKIYGKDRITKSMYADFKELFSVRNVEQNLFHSLHNILNDYQGIEENIDVYNSDRSLIPMMIFENYIKYIDNKTDDNEKKLICMNNILDKITESDNIDYQIYNYQLWYLQNFNCINYCCNTSYQISTLSDKKLHYDIEFTHLLSKSALQYFNYQNMVYFKKILELDKENCLYLIHLILNMLFSNDLFEKGLLYLKELNEGSDVIYKLIKMVKLSDNIDFKKLYTNQFKNMVAIEYNKL
jgi:SpoVK/Ycf46/Vps4 family AAA+-type ATPase